MTGQGWGHRAAAMSLLVAGLGLAGCAEIEASTPATYEPAALESTTPDGPKKVTFTDVAAERVELNTATVGGRPAKPEVDYAALVYDKTGKSWVFSVLAPLTFQRVAVEVDRIEGNKVLLRRGPAPGTEVVTQGAIEVWGAELGISGKH